MTNIEIYLNNGKVINASMENYQSGSLAQSLNDQRILFITIGDAIVNRNMIQLILPATAEQTA